MLRLTKAAGFWLTTCAPLVLQACAPASDTMLEFAGETMGTTYHVALHPLPDGQAADELPDRVDALLASVNQRMSTYIDDSEISKFNASASTTWFDLSDETHAVLEEAQRINRLSDGAFDVTVGPAVNLWGFGPGATEPRVPSPVEIADLTTRIGQSLLGVRAEPPAARKAHPDLYVDLSAIAKGYAVDEIASLLEQLDIAHYLVEIGGELRARGVSHRGDRWRVAIEKPVVGERSVYKVLQVGDTGVATSGNYRNFFDRDGKRYSHTIDPRTARPVEHALASVTVLHPSAMTADALATAFTVLGPDEGLTLAGELGVAALFIVVEDSMLKERPSRAYVEWMENS